VSTAFETKLREDLHAAADHAAPGSFDPATIIGEGTRVVRRRRLRRGLGAVAAVTVLALLATGSALWHGGRDDSAPVPPAQRTVLGAVVSATLSKDGANLNGTDVPGPDRLAVELDTGTGELRFSAVSGDGARTVLGGSSVSGVPQGATWGTGTGVENVWVGVVPKGATNLMPVGEIPAAGGGGATQDQAPLAGTDFDAFAIWFEKPADLEGLTTLLWQDSAGRVQAADSSPVGSVAFTDHSGSRVTVFVSEEGNTLGVIDATGSARVALHGEGQGTVPDLQAGSGSGPTFVGTVVALLPKGSTRPAADFATGLGNPRLQAQDVPGTGYTAVFTSFAYDRLSSSSPWMTSIRWTGADGAAKSVTLR
jgi:hypothetical protein